MGREPVAVDRMEVVEADEDGRDDERVIAIPLRNRWIQRHLGIASGA
jgi:hypothetical protein